MLWLSSIISTVWRSVHCYGVFHPLYDSDGEKENRRRRSKEKFSLVLSHCFFCVFLCFFWLLAFSSLFLSLSLASLVLRSLAGGWWLPGRCCSSYSVVTHYWLRHGDGRDGQSGGSVEFASGLDRDSLTPLQLCSIRSSHVSFYVSSPDCLLTASRLTLDFCGTGTEHDLPPPDDHGHNICYPFSAFSACLLFLADDGCTAVRLPADGQ